jgi:hypothetical protein
MRPRLALAEPREEFGLGHLRLSEHRVKERSREYHGSSDG